MALIFVLVGIGFILLRLGIYIEDLAEGLNKKGQ
jgi:hypothetical protein